MTFTKGRSCVSSRREHHKIGVAIHDFAVLFRMAFEAMLMRSQYYNRHHSRSLQVMDDVFEIPELGV